MAPLAVLTAVAILALTPGVLASGGESNDPRVRAGAEGPAAGAPPKPRPKAKPKRNPHRPLSATGILRLGDKFAKASGYERYSYILVARHMARSAARLPGKTLVYMSGTSVYPRWSSGVTYGEAVAGNWLLRDASGAHVMNKDFGAFIADIGDPAYQRRFIDNVLAFLRANKSDGLFLDDVIATPLALGDVYPAKYPSQAAWEKAMVAFVASVGEALRKNGFYILTNASAWIPGDAGSSTGATYARLYRQVAPHVDGIMTEWWVQNPANAAQMRADGANWWENWGGWQALASLTQEAGADFFALTYGSKNDVRAKRYGRASFLLDWNGRGGAFLWESTDHDDPYHPVSVKQIGLPAGSKFQRLPGVWQRRFERGIVIVNTTNAPVAVRIGAVEHSVGPTDALFARLPRARGS